MHAFVSSVVVLMHDTNLVGKLSGFPLPPEKDPMSRVRGWKETAALAGEARRELLREGKPVFLVGDHYGITSQLAFYLPEAREAPRERPLVYSRSTERPENQFWFWPGYAGRVGENAVFVRRGTGPKPPPPRLAAEFASVEDLGMREVRVRGKVVRRIQLYACRGLLAR